MIRSTMYQLRYENGRTADWFEVKPGGLLLHVAVFTGYQCQDLGIVEIFQCGHEFPAYTTHSQDLLVWT